MKKLLLIMLLLGFQLAVINAQDNRPPAPGRPGGPGGPGQMSPKERIEELKAKLQLTDEQASKIETFFKEDQKKMESLFEKREEDFAEMKKSMDKINETTDAAINKLLTPEQKNKYKKILEDRKKEMERMPPPPDHNF